ncbi:glycosyltransferase family 4 protein [Pontibacter sp. MBLB2868]|uniref:glycosyltransferase family 4 protein n=1 Tax=Pontibacter sp. MBLB2868 TaxID=3451555 RepID=UPI003F74E038
MRLAVITSHPIQYNVPFFKLLAQEEGVILSVFYTLGQDASEIIDRGFGKKIKWDIPLLDGYEYKFVQNTAKEPDTSHFKGIVNPTLIAAIERFKPSHLLIYGWSFDSHLRVMKYYKNKAIVLFRGDSTLLDEQGGMKTLLRRIFLTFIYSYIDKAIYVGSHNKQYFLKHGIKEQDLVFAPHAIDNERFADEKKYKKEGNLIREELGIPEENRVFLFTGKFEKKKNPLLLLKVFKSIEQDRISLLFVGNGALEESLKSEAAGCANIYFLPFQNQKRMPAVYRSADILVLPSSGPGETWGLCVNEAMASGLPVIVSNKVGCAIDLVQEGFNGYTFEARSEESLSKVLNICALKSKGELNLMGKASSAIISGWSYEHVCQVIRNELLPQPAKV